MANLGQTASLLGKIAGYIEILSKDPHSTAFVSLAEAYRQMGLLDDALEIVEKGVAFLPKFSPGYTCLGRIQGQRGELKAAYAAFSRALEIDPDSVPTLKGLARVCGVLGQKERSRELLERASHIQPEDAAVAKMLAALGPAPSAPVAVVPAQELIPADNDADASEAEDARAPIATATIAEIYVKQGLLGKARQVYRGLLQANPGNAGLEERYRELDRQLKGEGATAVAVPEQATSSVSASAGSAGGDDEQSLATLRRWLDAIRDRRDHVR